MKKLLTERQLVSYIKRLLKEEEEEVIVRRSARLAKNTNPK